MNAARLRSLLRWVHLCVAAILGTYFYSPLLHDPLVADIIRFAVIPAATATGLWLWQQGRVARFFRSRRAS